MPHAYLIIDPATKLAAIVKAIYFYRWDWLNETEETSQAPYTRLYADGATGTRIFYREEHKDVFDSRYFYIEGDEIAPIIPKLRAATPLLSASDLIGRFEAAEESRARGSAIYQLGIALAGQPYDDAAAAAFRRGLADPALGVRIATLWGMAWPHWAALRLLAEQAAADADVDVRHTAMTLLEAFAREG